jgi:hypothetical protein
VGAEVLFVQFEVHLDAVHPLDGRVFQQDVLDHFLLDEVVLLQLVPAEYLKAGRVPGYVLVVDAGDKHYFFEVSETP